MAALDLTPPTDWPMTAQTHRGRYYILWNMDEEIINEGIRNDAQLKKKEKEPYFGVWHESTRSEYACYLHKHRCHRTVTD